MHACVHAFILCVHMCAACVLSRHAIPCLHSRGLVRACQGMEIHTCVNRKRYSTVYIQGQVLYLNRKFKICIRRKS